MLRRSDFHAYTLAVVVVFVSRTESLQRTDARLIEILLNRYTQLIVHSVGARHNISSRRLIKVECDFSWLGSGDTSDSKVRFSPPQQIDNSDVHTANRIPCWTVTVTQTVEPQSVNNVRPSHSFIQSPHRINHVRRVGRIMFGQLEDTTVTVADCGQCARCHRIACWLQHRQWDALHRWHRPAAGVKPTQSNTAGTEQSS